MQHKFVKNIPDNLEEDTLYISLDFRTVIHKCCCGCGEEVVTPLSPTDWKITYNGETISLYPSIGNWSYKCQSHYWIENNKVIWAKKWSRKKIEEGRKQDALNKQVYYKKRGEITFHVDKKDNYISLLLSKIKKMFLKK